LGSFVYSAFKQLATLGPATGSSLENELIAR